jgi:hypothetical protein
LEQVLARMEVCWHNSRPGRSKWRLGTKEEKRA